MPIQSRARLSRRAHTQFAALLLGAGLLCTAVPHAAKAQSLDDMRRQLNAMQKRIDQMEGEQRRAIQQARQVQQQAEASARGSQDQAVALEARTRAVEATTAKVATQTADITPQLAPPKDFPGSFVIPGTTTAVRLSGQIKVNGTWDAGPLNRADTITAQSVPLKNSTASRSGGDYQLAARRSRLTFETRTPGSSDVGPLATLFEFDFAGGNSSATVPATNNAYTPRLRKAYAQLGYTDHGSSVLIGQTESLFDDSIMLPVRTLSDWDFVGISNVRQAQVRYAYGFGDGLSAAVSLENSYSDITTTAGTSYPDTNGGGGLALSTAPDFAARLMKEQPWYTLALRGVLRPEIALNNEAATAASGRYNKSTTGWGVGATGSVKLLDGRLQLEASVNYGPGLGRYLTTTSAGFGALSNAGLAGVTSARVDITPVKVLGAMVGASYKILPTLQANVSLGGGWLDNPGYVGQFGGCSGAAVAAGTCEQVNSRMWGEATNLIWTPIPRLDVGVEYQHVERTLAHRNAGGTSTGTADRIQTSAIVRF